MHFKKMVTRGATFFCVLMLLVSLVPSAFAKITFTNNLTDKNIVVASPTEKEGTNNGGNDAGYAIESTWNATGNTITGKVIPGDRYTRKLIFTTRYPTKGATSTLTLQNGLTEEATLSFYYSQPGNAASKIEFSGDPKIEGNQVSIVLAGGAKFSITLTTPTENVPADTSRDLYTAEIEITGLALQPTAADLNISMTAATGGSYTVSDGTETKGAGESFVNPKETVYALTASEPELHYHFDGWLFNGALYSDTSRELTGVTFKADTVIEAKYSRDAIYELAKVNGDHAKDDLVDINSRYIHQPRNELVETKTSGNGYTPYHTLATKMESDYCATQYVPSLHWTLTGDTAKVGREGRATGQYETGGARSWAYANMVSDVIRFYAKEDCIIEFNYSGSVPKGYDLGLWSLESATGLHVYESTSGNETIANISKGTNHTAASGKISVSLAKGQYLYVYTNGYVAQSETLAGGSTAMEYSYSGTISGVTVTPNETKYTQTTTFKDNVGNVLKGGKLTLNRVSYTSGDDGMISVAAMPGGQAMQITSVTAPTNYVFLYWEVNGQRHCAPTYEYPLNANTTVNPIFAPKHVTYDVASNKYQYKNINGAMVDLNGQYIARNTAYTEFYTSLKEAFEKTNEVVLLGNLTINGDFEVPNGEVLIVPSFMNDVFNKADGVYIPTTSPVGSGAYATLTMNGNLIVNGTLLVSGQQTASNGGPGGSYGAMTIASDKVVTISENKALYGYGLVNGTGEIVAKKGATVHELCQILDLSHPMLVSDMVMSNSKDYRIMPFNSFYINTIEAKATYEYGATLYGHLSLSYDTITQSAFPAIAPSGSILVVNSGSVTKYYDNTSGKITFRANEGSDVESGAFKASLSVTLAVPYDAELESQKFVLPMSAGYQFIVAGNLTMKHDFKMLPGCKVDVLKSGKLIVAEGADLVFYRLNDYDYRKPGSDTEEGIAFTSAGYPINISRHSGFSVANIGSAHLNVDGEVIVQGGLYVTEAPIDDREETDSALAYKNYVQYDNGFNILTGTGRIDASGAKNTENNIYEHQHKYQLRTTNAVSVKIVPIKGLPEGATPNEDGDYAGTYVGKYVSLVKNETYTSGKFKGVIDENGLNVWGEDPCANGHTEEIDAAVGKTCTTAGKTEGKHCSVCGDILVAQEVIPAGHTPGAAATCATAQECTVCHTQLAPATGAHSYTVQQQKVEATCGKDGYVIHKCETCDGTQKTTLPATGSHSYSDVVTAPTCTEKGYTTHTCTVCGDVVKDTEVPATGHTVVLDTSKGENGYTWAADNSKVTAHGKCSKCTYTETKEAAASGNVTEEPTCSEMGETTYTASFADGWAKTETDLTMVAKNVEIDPDAHTMEEAYHSDANGHELKCAYCTYTTGKVEHSYGDWIIDTEASCTTNGAKHRVCSVCKFNEASTTIPATGHVNTTTTTVDATCTEAGSTTVKCACGEIVSVTTIPALGHDNTVTFTWSDGEPVSAVANISCSRCGTTETQTATVTKTGETAGDCMTKATKTYKAEYSTYVEENHVVEGEKNMSVHTVEAEWTQTATTHKQAYTCCGTVAVAEEDHEWNENHVCGECGYICQHNWSDWTETQAPTCEAAGSKSRTCSYCQMVETESVEAKGHTKVEIPAVPATCTTDGSTAGVKCSVCQEVITAPTKVDMLGHNMQETAAKVDATCTSTGTTAVMGCTRCDYTEGGAVIGKLPHNMTHVAAAKATCTDAGNKEYWLCSSCNIYYKNEAGTEAYTEEDKWQIAAQGHSMKLVKAVAKTCTTNGNSEYYDCENCDHYSNDAAGENEILFGSWVIPASHDFNTEKWETNENNHYHKCINCTVTKDEAAHADGDDDHLCDVCDYKVSVCSDVVTDQDHNCDTCGAENVTQHSYTEKVTAPTCTEQGYTTYNCNCGSSYTENYRDALTHEWEVAAAVWNGTESASVTRTCKRDGCQATETATSTSVKAEVTTQPTYNAKGQTTYTATFNETWASAQKTLTDVPMLEGVAKVISGDTETNYGTLAEAMDNAADGDTIVLLQKYTVTGTETWDLTGKTLRIPTVEGNYGIVVKGDLTIVGGTFDVQAVYGIGVTGKLTVTGGTFNGAKNVSDYIIGNWGTTSITGGEFNGWYCCVNNFDGGELTVSGGTFEVTSGDQEIDGIVYESAEILADSGASITGGTFAQEPEADLIATGYCVKTNSDNTASVISHTAGEAKEENRTEPTCTTAGGYDTVVRCTNCNEVLSSETVTLDALTHQWKATDYKWEQAEGKWSCTATRSCGREGCGETETATANVASAEKTAATCTVKGWTTYTASFDVKWADIQTQEKQDIAVIDHTYSEETVSDAAKKSDATCTEAAVYYYSCECGAIGTETFEYGQKLGHSYSSTQTEAPTCTEKGELTYTCSRCSDSYTEPVKETGHSYNAVVTAPTCEKQGYTTHTCSNDGCGDSYVDNYVEETGHDWDEVIYEWSQDKATCTASRTCKNDTSHVEVETATANKIETPPTCTEDGSYYYEAVFTKDWAETQKTVTYTGESKTGHSYTWTQTLAPTCTTPGSKSGVCSICSATTTEAVNVDDNAHSWAEKYSYDKNDHWFVCNNGCETVEKVAHTLGESRTEATFDRNAYTTYTCDCGYSYEVEEENTKLTAVAQIGTQKYQTLDEAIIAANASETDVTIELLATVNTAPATFVSAEVTVALGDYHLTWVNANNDLRALKAIAADGFTVQDNKDGTYTFVRATVAEPENGEAAIGNKVYATLAEAIADANDGAFINLKADVTDVPTGINKNLVIIPNGFKLAGAEAEAALTLLQGKVAEGYAVRTNYGLFFINKQTNGSGIVAKIGEVGYYTVKEALEAAKDGDTVVMVADSDESQSDMIMVPGVTLYLGAHDLSVRSLVGAEGSKVYGETYHATKDYCKLKASTLILGSEAQIVSDYPTIPIFNPDLDCYVFSKYRTRTDYDVTGLFIHKGTEDKTDDDENRIYFQFGQQMTGAVGSLMGSTYSADQNKFQVIVQLKWNGETGSYVQNYSYRNDFVQSVAGSNGGKNYTFTLEGYEHIGLTEEYFDSLEVCAMIVTDSGVTVCSEIFTPKNAKYN